MNTTFLIVAGTLAAALASVGTDPPRDEKNAEPERLVIRASTIITSPGKSISRGVIVIEGGKITAIGSDLGIPNGAHVKDYGDATVAAGFVDAQSDAGVEGEITDTTRAFTPAVRTIDAFRPNRGSLRRAALEGITTIGIAADGENVAGGLGAVVKSFGADRSVRDEAFLKLSLSRNAFDAERFPTSLGGGIAELERRWREAGTDAKQAKGAEARALARGRKELRVFVEISDLIGLRRLLKLAKSLDIHPVVVVTDGDLTEAAGELAAAKVPVVLPPLQFESTPAQKRAPALFAKAGVEVAFATLGSRSGLRPMALRLGASLAIASGLDPAAALAAITTIPAKLLGVESNVGTLEVGRDADVVVLSGDPLVMTSAIRDVYVRGESPKQGDVR